MGAMDGQRPFDFELHGGPEGVDGPVPRVDREAKLCHGGLERCQVVDLRAWDFENKLAKKLAVDALT